MFRFTFEDWLASIGILVAVVIALVNFGPAAALIVSFASFGTYFSVVSYIDVSTNREERSKQMGWDADPQRAAVEKLMEDPRKLAEAVVDLRDRDPWLNRIYEESL